MSHLEYIGLFDRGEWPLTQTRRATACRIERQGHRAAPPPVEDDRGLPGGRGSAPVRPLVQVLLIHLDVVGLRRARGEREEALE